LPRGKSEAADFSSWQEGVLFKDNFEREVLGDEWRVEVSAGGSAEARITTDPETSQNRVLRLSKERGHLRVFREFSLQTNFLFRLKVYDSGPASSTQPGFFLTLRNDEGATIGMMAREGNYFLRLFTVGENGVKNVPVNNPCVSPSQPSFSFAERERGWHTVEFIVTPAGSYLKFDGTVVTRPPTPSSDWSFTFANKLDICRQPLLREANNVNLILTWGEEGEEGSFYIDEVEMVRPSSDGQELARLISKWYLEMYGDPEREEDYLGDSYQRIFERYSSSPADIQQSHEGVAIFHDLIVRALRCWEEREVSWCQDVSRRLETVFNYRYPNGLQPFSVAEWPRLDSWRFLPLTTEDLVLLDFLMKDHLSSELRQGINERVKVAFEKFADLLPGSCDGTGGTGWPGIYRGDCAPGNTTAEENAWFAGFFAAVYNHLKKNLPHYPRLEEVNNKARCFAYHSLTTDKDPPAEVCPAVRTKTIYQHYQYPPEGGADSGRYFLVNHNMIHPNYMAATIALLGRGAYYYLLINEEDPPAEFSHHVVDLWNEFWGKEDGEICNFENTCSEDHPECCGFFDKDTFFYRRNFERFQGGFLIAGISALFPLERIFMAPDLPLKLSLLQKKFLFQYKTPAVVSLPQRADLWNGAWIINVTTASNYVRGYLMMRSSPEGDQSACERLNSALFYCQGKSCAEGNLTTPFCWVVDFDKQGQVNEKDRRIYQQWHQRGNWCQRQISQFATVNPCSPFSSECQQLLQLIRRAMEEGSYDLRADVFPSRPDGVIDVKDEVTFYLNRHREGWCASFLSREGVPSQLEKNLVGGRIVRCDQRGRGVEGVTVQITNLTHQRSVQTTTDSQGYFRLFSPIAEGELYRVTVVRVPSGFSLPPRTTAAGWNWNFLLNPSPGTQPWADTPLGSSSYNGQKMGTGIHCAGPDNQGRRLRCNFCLNSE